MVTVSGRATNGLAQASTWAATWTDAPATAGRIIGMSSPAGDWSTRLGQVGTAGITARRIFAQLNSTASDQVDLIEDAHEAGMIPVVSFKIPSVATGKSGGYDAWVERLADRLEAYDRPTTVTFHHEPNGDMVGADFASIWRRYLPILSRGKVKAGPFVNGWLLDNQLATFASYAPDDLLAAWDWFGIDTYESGTIEAPGDKTPASRLPKLKAFVASRGFAGKPLGIGEYNGYSGTTIAAAGEAFLADPQVLFACMWNATTGKGHVLEGARLTAFRGTLADSRTRKQLGALTWP